MLYSFFANMLKRNRGQQRKGYAKQLLKLESLEDRVVLDAYRWIGG